VTRALVALVGCLGCALALAAGASGGRPNAADLESEFVCPVCETTLDQSNAPIAQRMKAFIRARIAAGDDEEQIKDALVAEFGPGVVAKPPGGGFGLLAWLLPLVAVAGGAVVIGLLILIWSRRRPPPSGPEEELDPRLERLVDDELARLDS